MDSYTGSVKSNRVPSLDGLRAVSVLMVIVGHVAMRLEMHHLKMLGSLGVKIFFVISGFIITKLLIEEHQSHGRISLTNFYARRSLRILPAAYFFLLIVFFLGHSGYISLQTGDLFY